MLDFYKIKQNEVYDTKMFFGGAESKPRLGRDA